MRVADAFKPPSAFELEARRLHRAQLEAESVEARAEATEELSRFLREHSRGRWKEPFDPKLAQAGKDE